MRASGLIRLALLLTALIYQPVWAQESEPQESPLQSLGPWLANYRTYPAPLQLPTSPADCQLRHIDFTGRHGSRYPKDTEIELIPQMFGELIKITANRNLSNKGKVLLERARDLNTWTQTHRKPSADITPKGWQELYDIGFRNAGFFESTEHTYPDKLIVSLSSSETKRTMHSQEAFWEGLQSAVPTQIQLIAHLSAIENPKWVLHNYKVCFPTYSDFSRTTQKKDFQQRSQTLAESLPDASVDIARQLVSDCPKEKAADLLQAIYRLCLFDASRETAFGLCELPASWIDIPGGVDVLNWLKQTQSWRKFYDFGLSAFQNGVAADLASPLLRDILEQTELSTHLESDTVSANYRFSHDSMLAKLMTKLEILPAAGTDEERFQGWNPSVFTPMAANIQLHLYQCSDGPKVSLLLNERMIDWPIEACANQSLCGWTQVRDYYQSKVVADEILKTYCPF